MDCETNEGYGANGVKKKVERFAASQAEVPQLRTDRKNAVRFYRSQRSTRMIYPASPSVISHTATLCTESISSFN